MVPEFTILIIECDETYLLGGSKIVACLNGSWTPNIGHCSKTCPPIYSTSILTVKCSASGKETMNCTDVLDGTIAHFRCASFYEDSRLARPQAVCTEGKWSESVPDCRPVCGRTSTTRGPTLIVSGRVSKKGQFPWQAALYSSVDQSFLCGGSLINEKLILTAAHCITDVYGKMLNKEDYLVAVGKHYRKYDDPRDSNHSQTSVIQDMFVPDEFEGDTQNLLADIALIVTVKTFILSERVQPVCIDWTRNYESAILNSVQSKKEFVSGWGYTRESGNLSNELRQLEVPSIPKKKCKKDVPEEYKRYVTYDKLCAGYLENGSSVCNGDSGGGLVFKYSNRFFIAGVVSLSPLGDTAEGGCNSHQYGLYTVVYNYSDNFILRNLVRFKPSIGDDSKCVNCTTTTPPPTTTDETGSTVDPTEPTEPTKSTERPEDGCILPEHPDSGRWSVLGNSSQLFSPGKFVENSTTLRVQCNEKHKLDGDDLLVCRSGSWSAKLGKCLKTCSSIQNTVRTKVVCEFKNREIVNCSDPFDGTIAKFKCAQFYEEKSLNLDPLLCVNGTWSRPAPKCVPVCGQKSNPSATLIVNGSTAFKGEFPWQAVIYERGESPETNVLICSGTLISERIILTGDCFRICRLSSQAYIFLAARCVVDLKGELVPKSEFIVAVGKYYLNYSDPRDVHQAQFSQVEDIFIPVEYKRIFQHSLGNIAIMVSKKVFKFTLTVQPVCVDWTKSSDDILNSKEKEFGYVNDWRYITRKPPDELRSIRVLFVSRQNCVPDFIRNLGNSQEYEYMTADKLCASYRNGTFGRPSHVGAGLVFKHADNRFYIVGIFAFQTLRQYVFYTDVKLYVDNFLLEKVARYNIL
jgi:secreted trypsin-like serine protease